MIDPDRPYVLPILGHCGWVGRLLGPICGEPAAYAFNSKVNQRDSPFYLCAEHAAWQRANKPWLIERIWSLARH